MPKYAYRAATEKQKTTIRRLSKQTGEKVRYPKGRRWSLWWADAEIKRLIAVKESQQPPVTVSHVAPQQWDGVYRWPADRW